MTLTLDFEGQILKMLYLGNGRADWHGTKGMQSSRKTFLATSPVGLVIDQAH